LCNSVECAKPTPYTIKTPKSMVKAAAITAFERDCVAVEGAVLIAKFII
jgi:hypothetical protein